MTIAAVVLAAGAGSRFEGDGHKLRADLAGRPVLSWAIDSALEAGFDEVAIVVGDDEFSDLVPESVVVIHAPDWDAGQSRSLAAATAWAEGAGHDAIVVGMADQPLVGAYTWRALRLAESSPIVAANYGGRRRPPTRLDRSVWSRLPTSGDEGARVLMADAPELVTTVVSAGNPLDVDTADALVAADALVHDRRAVVELLGREPMGYFEVAVRADSGAPVVLKNFPVLADGRPMPTLYWLCGDREVTLVGRLESIKGVRRAERDIGLDAIADAHRRYAAERDGWLDSSGIDVAHRPTGGVGGTRTGVKCLHAHYGWWLAGGDDPVGKWVADHLDEVDTPHWPSVLPPGS